MSNRRVCWNTIVIARGDTQPLEVKPMLEALDKRLESYRIWGEGDTGKKLKEEKERGKTEYHRGRYHIAKEILNICEEIFGIEKKSQVYSHEDLEKIFYEYIPSRLYNDPSLRQECGKKIGDQEYWDLVCEAMDVILVGGIDYLSVPTQEEPTHTVPEGYVPADWDEARKNACVREIMALLEKNQDAVPLLLEKMEQEYPNVMRVMMERSSLQLAPEGAAVELT